MSDVLMIAVIFYFLYKIIELFVHKKERLLLIDKIEKIGQVGNINGIQEIRSLFMTTPETGKKFWSLRWGLLLAGVGLGMVVGYVMATYIDSHLGWGQIETASAFLFGGIALAISFIVERILASKDADTGK